MQRRRLETLSDDELLATLRELIRDERTNLLSILRTLVELEKRELAERIGRTSLFVFLVRDLGYSEAEAKWRIRAARAARAAARYPSLYRLLKRGKLTLCAVSMLEPHLRRGNAGELIRKAIGMSTRGLEAMLDQLTPEKPPMDRVRYVGPPPLREPEPAPPGPDLFTRPPAEALPGGEAPDAAAPGPGEPWPAPAVARPAPAVPPPAPPPAPRPRVQFSFTAGEDLLRDVERAKEVLRHKYPAGRLEEIFGASMDALLERVDPERRLRRKAERAARSAGQAPGVPPGEAPADPSRRIPQAVKDAVWARDGGACAYVGSAGRCGARAWLEYDHVLPWALGGRSDDPANVRLLCRAHNRREAGRVLGPVVPRRG